MRQRQPTLISPKFTIITAITLTIAAGCGSDSATVSDPTDNVPANTGNTSNGNTDNDINEPVTVGSDTLEGMKFENFLAGSIVGDVTEVDCELSNGTQSRCYQFEGIGEPLDHTPGPFCPRSITDGAEAGGKWLDNGSLVDLDGAFIASLPQYYGPEWVLYDEQTGLVNVTDTPESCLAAAQLNPPQEWWYHCIECTIEGVGGAVVRQYTIPVEPTPRQTIAELGNTFPGVSLNGVGLSFPADLDGIVATYNIAALDDCAGHINNAEAYHYHGATGCWHEIAQTDEHAALIGYAMDGYAIHSMTNLDGGEPTDLDECRGHTDAVRGYHYHAASASENMFIGCFHGEVAVVQGGGPGGRPPR